MRPLLPLLLAATALAQPAFEAADLKPNKSGDPTLAVDFQPGGRFSARNVPLRTLIALANHVRPDYIANAPAWLSSDRYDIVAKASQTVPPDDIRRMLQTLLAERFKLAVHTEPRPMSAYALRLAKNGAKMQPSEATAQLTDQRCVPGAPPEGQKQVDCRHMTMHFFADVLQEIAVKDIHIPVVDQTALDGAFDFSLAWTPGLDADNPGPSLFDAVQRQLGLKLESAKLPLPVLVIDRIERAPSEN